ncbi:hypothetical protein HPB48_018697 [Haemaphysalis longicornis]|uniref:YqaJ viral recombinase domain-containing protein n=1 Tax=Haemaphysalis longicornis TaxID=44386 RepID=A0A9J6GWE6_HAELO|nr:hypothetical protein HPB48_018697 [Haemaphysalis longicornis]
MVKESPSSLTFAQRCSERVSSIARASKAIVFHITGGENNLSSRPPLREDKLTFTRADRRLNAASKGAKLQRRVVRAPVDVEDERLPAKSESTALEPTVLLPFFSSVESGYWWGIVAVGQRSKNAKAERYGIANKAIAAKHYEEVLRTMGHVTVLHCGLLVNPAFPWLGASPHRLVFDPAEESYGVLEIKCPYTLRDKKGEQLANCCFCSELTENGIRLKRDEYYYAQVVGQMGVSDLSWGGFVVYGKDFVLIERIRLMQAEWEAMKDQLLFNTFLPFLEGGSHQATV